MRRITNITKLTILSILLLTTLGVSTTYGQGKVSKALLQNDLDILKSNLEQIHPGLYTYSSKNQIDKWFIETKNNLKDSMDYNQFYEAVAPLNSLIKNGHSFVKLDRFQKDYNILPVRFYKYKDSFFIIDSFTDEYKSMIGQEIVAIDGKPIIEIFNHLLKYQTRDGENLTFPTEKLMYYFNLDYSLSYGTKSSYDITLLEAAKKSQVSLKSISWKDISFYERVPLQDFFSFTIKDSVAVLKYQTFEKSALRKIRYKKLLKEAFSSIKSNNINHLIIDVRNNGGGDAVPDQELISYLYDKEFKLFRKIYTITNKIEDKKYYKNEGVFLFNNVISWLKLKKVKENYYRANTKGSNLYSPKADNYKGNLYILINGRSFSATGEFTSFIKHHRNAVFIGEEVGGNKFQNSSGIPYYITLPNSKLRMLIPTILWELNVDVENDGHGVKPDYWVRNTITDEMEHRDSVMDFALHLIEESLEGNK
jgi:C-terminal processing protease CtpA/Prc